MFAKKDRDKIEDDELERFRKLAKLYENLTKEQVGQLAPNKAFVEICHDDKDKIQK
jgi:hypothetical protein